MKEKSIVYQTDLGIKSFKTGFLGMSQKTGN